MCVYIYGYHFRFGFYKKQVTKSNFLKKIEIDPKPVQTDMFRFGFFRTKTG